MSIRRPTLSSFIIELMYFVPSTMCRPLAISIAHFSAKTKRLLPESQTKSFKSIRHLGLLQFCFNHCDGLERQTVDFPSSQCRRESNSFELQCKPTIRPKVRNIIGDFLCVQVDIRN